MPGDENVEPKIQGMSAEEVAKACVRLNMPLLDHLRPRYARIASEMSWEERAEQLAAEINEWAQATSDRILSLEDPLLLRLPAGMHIAELYELYHGDRYNPRPSEDSYQYHLGLVASAA